MRVRALRDARREREISVTRLIVEWLRSLEAVLPSCSPFLCVCFDGITARSQPTRKSTAIIKLEMAAPAPVSCDL
jgi:hypothetical protein